MNSDDWIQRQEESDSPGGFRMKPTTPEPSFDPNEPWSDLPPVKKISPAAGFELVEELRKAGVPVRGKSKSAGLFSGGKVNMTLRVPTRLIAEAKRIISKQFGAR